ncbi:MAG TPA: DUF1697 domain-containing protein [Candidatus Binatia bacterium]|jgi:uncharacterized protein (DUF1697 family)|nr:DUF1697 domain-containing protein [Candidatus Binatia bacterium]
MPRYAALLRGVSPMNCKMADLKAALEGAGFKNVRTVLSSGNAVFDAPAATDAAVEKKCEAAMTKSMGKTFMTIVRRVDALCALVAADPYKKHRLSPDAKRIVTFLRDEGAPKLKLPIELDGASILAMKDGEVFSAYVPSPKGPVFMTLIEKTYGKEVTTRTFETVKKLCKA